MKSPFVNLTVAVSIVFSSFAPALAQSTSQLDNDVAQIIALANSNSDGRNDALIDDKINSMSATEQISLLKRMKVSLEQTRAQIQWMQAELNKGPTATISKLKIVRSLGTQLAMFASFEAMGLLIQTRGLLESVTSRLNHAERLAVSEKRLTEEYGQGALKDQPGQPKFNGSENLLKSLEPLTVMKDGKQVPSFTKILASSLERQMKMPVIGGGVISGKYIGMVGLSMAVAVIGSQIAISAIPVSAGDADLEKNIGKLKESLDRVDTVAETLALHLTVILQRFELAKLKSQLGK